MTESYIAIINDDMIMAALISVKENSINIEYYDSSDIPELNDFARYLEQNDPRLRQWIRDNETSYFVFEPIGEQDPLYVPAIIEELRMRNFLALAINAPLRQILESVFWKQYPLEQRKRIISFISNLPESTTLEISSKLAEILSISKNISSNHRAWQMALAKTEEELKKAAHN